MTIFHQFLTWSEVTFVRSEVTVVWSEVTVVWSEVTSIMQRTAFCLEQSDLGRNDHGA